MKHNEPSSEQWEEQFELMWGEAPVNSLKGKKAVVVKDFIRSLVEETRREALMGKSTRDSYIHVGFKRGYKKGLEQAIELVPDESPWFPDDDDAPRLQKQGYEICRDMMLENLKGELEK